SSTRKWRRRTTRRPPLWPTPSTSIAAAERTRSHKKPEATPRVFSCARSRFLVPPSSFRLSFSGNEVPSFRWPSAAPSSMLLGRNNKEIHHASVLVGCGASAISRRGTAAGRQSQNRQALRSAELLRGRRLRSRGQRLHLARQIHHQ